MRRVTIPLPGAGGMVTDAAPHMLSLSHAQLIRDGVLDQSLLKERRGWVRVKAGPGVELAGVSYARFDLANTTRLLGHTGRVPLAAAIASGVHIYDLDADAILHTSGDRFSPIYYPRCVYNDELIYCARTGLAPLRRYSGGDGSVNGATAATIAAGEGQLVATAGSFSATALGQFVSWAPVRPGVGLAAWPRIHFRVAKAATTAVTAEGLRSSVGFTVSPGVVSSAWAYPAVPLPSDGTASSDGSTITGYGTTFTTASQSFGGAIILQPEGLRAEHLGYPTTGVTATSIPSILGTNLGSTKMAFTLTSRLPFTDAQVHRGSLWGCGNYYYPNRVYVGPPGWRLGLPPGFSEPFDIGDEPKSFDPSEFTMFPIDVPAPGDDDPVVGLLPTDGPLLVLKRDSVHRIDGSYPVFSQRQVARGVGCIGLDAIVPADRGGPFWADRNGVYSFAGGQVQDLTSERIGRRWRQITIDQGWSDVTMAVADDKLIVSARNPTGTNAATESATFHYDINRKVWLGELTNVYPARTWWDAANDRLLSTVAYSTQGEVLDYATMYRDSRTVNANDFSGGGPTLHYQSGSAVLASRTGIDTEAILAEMSFELLRHSPGLSSGNNVGITIRSTGGVEQPSFQETVTPATTNTSLEDPAVQRVDVTVNAHGRQHSVEIRRTSDGNPDLELGIGQITLDVIDSTAGS